MNKTLGSNVVLYRDAVDDICPESTRPCNLRRSGSTIYGSPDLTKVRSVLIFNNVDVTSLFVGRQGTL